MKKILSLLVLVFLLSFTNAFAISYFTFEGGKFVKIPASSVKEKCGKNFAFREKEKSALPKYLTRSIIKAAFKGKMLPSLDAVKNELKAFSGKCGWLVSGESL